MKVRWFSYLLPYFVLAQIVLTVEIVTAKTSRTRLKRISTPYYNEEVFKSMSKYCVSIRSRTPYRYFGDNHYCGGSIISEWFILSSAHCVMDKRKIMHRNRVILVVAGAANRLKQIPYKTENLPVEEIFVPPNFTVFNTNNIALIKLKYKVTTNENVGIINLPTGPPVFGIKYRVLGWGRLFKGGPLSSRLLYVDVRLQDMEFCHAALESFSSEMLCAGNFDNELDEDPCAGDTGAPFINNLTVYGVASYGLGCGRIGVPSVYTNVWYHMQWINDTINVSSKYLLISQNLMSLSLCLISLLAI